MRNSIKNVVIFYFAVVTCGCSTRIDCPDKLNNIKIRNSNAYYNCGLKNLVIENADELSKICEMMSNIENSNVFSTRYNNGYIDIDFYADNNTERDMRLTLIFTVRKGMIFRANGNHFVHDDLAQYFIEKLNIENVSSTTKCLD